MEQTKALDALEPFLALSKSATSPRAAVDLITRATSTPNTFVFSELLETPQIQALSNSQEHLPHFQLLTIFCYGTYTDYISTPSLPPLNPAQLLKLRQLSLLTLAHNPANLTYASLLASLALPDTHALENLVISAIYADLLKGTLDPYNARICISSVAPLRDVSPSSVSSLVSTLHAWSSRCTTTLSTLERQIAAIKADAQRRHKEERDWEKYVDKLVAAETGGKKDKSGNGSGNGMAIGQIKLGRRGVTMKRLYDGENREGGEEDIEDVDMEDEEDGWSQEGVPSSKKRGLSGGLGFGR